MILLDTHAYYWFITDDEKLPVGVKDLIESTDEALFISIASFWEMTIKNSIGKLKLPATISTLMDDCSEYGINILPITASNLETLTLLPWIHRDPFDRLIISQAIDNKLKIATADENISKYDIDICWT